MEFSSRVASVQAVNRIAQATAAASSAGKPPFNLSDSNPTRHGLSIRGYGEALAAGAADPYEPDPRGSLEARAALAQRFGGDPDDYFLTSSTSESYSWLFKLLCDPGDAVLVPQPGYPLFDHLTGLESIRTIPYRIDYAHGVGWSIDLGGLAKAAVADRVKAVVVIHPNNPTGSYASSAERAALRAVCAERGIALIADEVFHPYRIDMADAPPRFAGDDGCLCFSLDGISKMLCLPQAKLGWIRVSGPELPVKEAQARLELIADTFLSASGPAMKALPSLLSAADGFIESVRDRLRRNIASLRDIFGGIDSAYRILECGGGWTALLEYPRYLPEEELVVGMIERRGLVAQPGHFFDFERDGYLALSLILEPARLEFVARALKEHIDGLAKG